MTWRGMILRRSGGTQNTTQREPEGKASGKITQLPGDVARLLRHGSFTENSHAETTTRLPQKGFRLLHDGSLNENP